MEGTRLVQEPLVEFYLVQDSPTQKLWNPKSFLVLTLLFSFLPAGIMYALNYGYYEEEGKKQTSLVLSIIAFIIFLTIAYFLPSYPLKSIAYILNVCVGIFLMITQRELFEEHIKNGGMVKSYLVPVLIGIIPLLLFVFAFMHLPMKSIQYGKSTLYYTDKITEDQAKKLEKDLESEYFFKKDSARKIKIDKKGNEYILSVHTTKKEIAEGGLPVILELHTTLLSNRIFNNNDVSVNLCTIGFIPGEKIKQPFKIPPKADN